MNQNGATLSAHGSTIVTREELARIPAPLSTATHRPIAHIDLDDILRDRLAAAGLGIARAQYAVQTEGMRLFGTYDLENIDAPGAGMALALGFRHANNKSMALQIVAGARVFVCDNLALSGDAKLFRNRHTHGVIGRLREAIGGYFKTLPAAVEMIRDRFGVWQAAGLDDDAAKVLLYDSIASGVIPSRIRPDVHAAYFNAETLGFEDCLPRTKFGLHNAFTRGIKALNPAPAYEANIGLTHLLGAN